MTEKAAEKSRGGLPCGNYPECRNSFRLHTLTLAYGLEPVSMPGVCG
jgi:hypothetical protein